MKWLCLSGLASVGLTMLTACAGNSTQSPTAPTTSTAVAVTSVTVTSTFMSSSTYQLTASARLSDSSMRDVTSSSQWSSSSALAVVSSTGLLTAVGTGDVVASAMYQNVQGTLKLTVTQPAAQKFVMLGVVHEVAPNNHTLSNARVAITSGPDAGTVVTTDEGGFFRFTLAPGLLAMQVTKDGYDPWLLSNLTVDRDRTADVFLYPLPPTNSAGALATARCTDGTWSWSVIRAQACSAIDGGIVYGVCPGLLCDGF